MRFISTILPQVFLVELEPRADDRGSFARVWCRDEFHEQGIETECVQASFSYNARRGTLRGMHYQCPPHCEDKLVRVLRGSIHDVVLDLRQNSPTYGQWFAAELNDRNGRGLFVPQGCAHGYLTLTDDCELAYFVSTPYSAEAARGIRWTADLLRGAWPFSPAVISASDSAWPETPTPVPVTRQYPRGRKAG